VGVRAAFSRALVLVRSGQRLGCRPLLVEESNDLFRRCTVGGSDLVLLPAWTGEGVLRHLLCPFKTPSRGQTRPSLWPGSLHTQSNTSRLTQLRAKVR